MEKLKNKFIYLKGKAKVLYLTAMMVVMTTMPVLAADNKYARNASDWIMDGVRVLVLAGAVCAIGLFILKRKFTQLIVAIVVSAVIIAIVYQPTLLKSIGDYLVSILFG